MAEIYQRSRTPVQEPHKAYGITLDLQSVDTEGWALPTLYNHEEYTTAVGVSTWLLPKLTE